MITGPLLRARSTRKEVRPSFVDPKSPRYREQAEALVALGHEAVQRAWSRGRLTEEIEERIVGNRVDHKLLRGLARVLSDRCDFDTCAPLPPPELRARLFLGGRVRGGAGPGGAETAQDRFGSLAQELGCSPQEVERGMFADLKENQVVLRCKVDSADWLLQRYNVALVQGLLLHAMRVEIELDAPEGKRARQLFRYIKFHQLMHRIRPRKGGFQVTLDGPASLFRLSTRYGMALANFFPALLLQTGPWRMEAKLKYKRLHRPMRIDHGQGLRSHLPDTGTWLSREERWFEERFLALDSGWELSRGGEIIALGRGDVLVPDFSFRREGRVAMMEVVGVWRRGYLERRLDLLRSHGRPELLLAVSRKLLSDKGKLPALGSEIIPFSSAIPAREVLKAVERVAVDAELRG